LIAPADEQVAQTQMDFCSQVRQDRNDLLSPLDSCRVSFQRREASADSRGERSLLAELDLRGSLIKAGKKVPRANNQRDSRQALSIPIDSVTSGGPPIRDHASGTN